MKKQVLKFSILFTICLLITSCKNDRKKETNTMEQESDIVASDKETLYRPNFHFSPKKGWMNDPNGMFFYNGYYHLYFQHYPDSTKWGPMHWGHALSTDMISWKEQPIALYPDELGYIFSGSAVVDHENTSGFGQNGAIPMVAIFTYHDPSKEEGGTTDVQTQGIAYSLDEGLTWIKYEGNPVLKNPGIRDFRDPKVTWDSQSSKWIMTLAASQETHFYASENLKDWKFLSAFGKGIGNHDGVWECPDLFPLKVEGSKITKWVLLVSINPGGPNGGSATQYFIGDFDGTTFTLDKTFGEQMKKEHSFWVDHGRDNYAGVGWTNVSTSNGGKLFMGWMSNWMYANEVPTDPWRSAMTIAREVQLINGTYTYRLVSKPVKELNNYRSTKYKKVGISVSDEIPLITSDKINLSKAEIHLKIEELKNTIYKFKLSNKAGNELLFGYNHKDGIFYIDRTKSGKVNFSEKFADRISRAPRTSNNGDLTATILLDKTSIEIFFDNGETVMTEIFFPNAPYETFSVASENEEFTINYLEIHELKFN